MQSLNPSVLLPDGTEFTTWEIPFKFSKTYNVDQSHPDASDDNPGSADKPFLTIGQAAEVLLPGERVVVNSGVYREWVKPRRGGSSPEAMISYEAAPNATVILKGTAVFQEKWTRYQSSGLDQTEMRTLWSAPLAPEYFRHGYNPFDIDNVTPEQFVMMREWVWEVRGALTYTLPR